jgi:hypothetical protein
MSKPAAAAMKQQMLDEAIAATGYDDFGNPAFLENMDRHLASIDEEGRVTANGLKATAAQHGLALRALLHAQAGFKARPDAMAQPIIRPLIIAGIPRSGTTALHRLLSIDPQFQGYEHWLTRAPMPRPPRETWPGLRPYQEAKAGLDAVVAAAPEMLNDHMHEVDAVEESLFLLAATFCSNHFPEQWHVPSYDAWYRQSDEVPSYMWLADTHRLIGADAPGRRWLIKNPTDIFSIRAVLTAFPDAMIVQTHRDPVEATPSLVNLLANVRRMYEEENFDPELLIRRDAEFWELATRRVEAAKAREPGRYLDVDFRDFTRDQMATIHRIYDYFGLVLASPVEDEMRRWLADNPRRETSNSGPKHRAEDFGMASGELAEIFSDYRKKYGYA